MNNFIFENSAKVCLRKFIRFARNVWNIGAEGKPSDEVALAGIQALEDFIKKIGLPTTLRELGMSNTDMLPDVAASCNIAPGSYGNMSKKAILEILIKCY